MLSLKGFASFFFHIFLRSISHSFTIKWKHSLRGILVKKKKISALFRLKYSLTSLEYTATFLFPKFELQVKLPSLFQSTYTVHDYSKTNERIDLRLNTLSKNMTVFYMNNKLSKKDRPKSFYKPFSPNFLCKNRMFFQICNKNANFKFL